MPRVEYKDFVTDKKAESSEQIPTNAIEQARQIQLKRFAQAKIVCNAQNVTCYDKIIL